MPYLNSGGAGHMHIHAGAMCPSNATQNGLLAFDLSSLPTDTEVLAATLHVWTHITGNMQTDLHTLHRVNESWVEGSGDDVGVVGGATWGDRDTGTPWRGAGCTPPSCEDAVIGMFQLAAGPALESQSSIDVATVQGWVDGTYPNYGFAIRTVSTLLSSAIASSESQTDGVRPTLVLTVR